MVPSTSASLVITKATNVARVSTVPTLALSSIGPTCISSSSSSSSIATAITSPNSILKNPKPTVILRSVHVTMNGVKKKVLIPMNTTLLSSTTSPSQPHVKTQQQRNITVITPPKSKSDSGLIPFVPQLPPSTNIKQSPILVRVTHPQNTPVMSPIIGSTIKPLNASSLSSCKVFTKTSDPLFLNIGGEIYSNRPQLTKKVIKIVNRPVSMPISQPRLDLAAVPGSVRTTAPSVLLESQVPGSQQTILASLLGSRSDFEVAPVVIAPDNDDTNTTHDSLDSDVPSVIKEPGMSPTHESTSSLCDLHMVSSLPTSVHNALEIPHRVIEIAPIGDKRPPTEPKWVYHTIPSTSSQATPSLGSGASSPDISTDQSSTDSAILEADEIVCRMFQKSTPTSQPQTKTKTLTQTRDVTFIQPAKSVSTTGRATVRTNPKDSTPVWSFSQDVKTEKYVMQQRKRKRPNGRPSTPAQVPPEPTKKCFFQSQNKTVDRSIIECHVAVEKLDLSHDAIVSVINLDSLWVNCPRCPIEAARKSRESLKAQRSLRQKQTFSTHGPIQSTAPSTTARFFKVKDSSGNVTLVDMGGQPETMRVLNQECVSKGKFLLVKTSTGSFLVPTSQLNSKQNTSSNKLLAHRIPGVEVPGTPTTNVGVASPSSNVSSILNAATAAQVAAVAFLKKIRQEPASERGSGAVLPHEDVESSEVRTASEGTEGSGTDTCSEGESPRRVTRQAEPKEVRIQRLREMMKKQEAQLDQLRKEREQFKPSDSMFDPMP